MRWGRWLTHSQMKTLAVLLATLCAVSRLHRRDDTLHLCTRHSASLASLAEWETRTSFTLVWRTLDHLPISRLGHDAGTAVGIESALVQRTVAPLSETCPGTDKSVRNMFWKSHCICSALPMFIGWVLLNWISQNDLSEKGAIRLISSVLQSKFYVCVAEELIEKGNSSSSVTAPCPLPQESSWVDPTGENILSSQLKEIKWKHYSVKSKH